MNATSVRSRVFLLWDQLRNLTLDASTDPVIVAAIRGAEQQYFKEFIGLADEMRKVSANDAKYRMNANQWVDTTTPLLGSLLEVMYAAGKASETYTAQALGQELRAAAVSGGLLVLCLVIAGLSFWAVLRIVTRPLSDLAGAMRALSDGNSPSSCPD